jgi:hypothetical protein
MSYTCTVRGMYSCTDGTNEMRDIAGRAHPGMSEPCEHAYVDMVERASNWCRADGFDVDKVACCACDCTTEGCCEAD